MAWAEVKHHLYSQSMKHSEQKYPMTQKRVTDLSVLILAVWTVVALLVPNVVLSFTEQMSVWARVTNVVLPLGLFCMLLSLTRKIGKAVVLMLPLMIFAAFQLVLLYLYGRSVIAVDMFLNVVTTNPGEVGELLGNLTPIMIVVFVLYLPPLAVGSVAWSRKWLLPDACVRMTRKCSLVIMVLGFVLLAVSKFSKGNYAVHKHLFPINAIYNMCTAINRTMLTSHYDESSAGFSYQSVSERSDSMAQTYVLVIGETSRAINWQLLGADEATNPTLMGREGLVAFDKALSQSNTTHKSVPMLISHLEASNFGDSVYCSKSIITAFKEAGFTTWFLSNHLRNRSFIDFFGQEADTCLFIRDYEEELSLHSDFSLLPYFQNALNSSERRKLIVLHTYGSHFNYADRYPESMRKFMPDSPSEAKPEYRESLLNAYNNSVLSTAALLDSVITSLQSRDALSAMVYASDHGEDIFDDERNLFLHASPCPSYFQIHVPMLVWISSRLNAQYPQLLASANDNAHKYVASSEAYFHTAMQLAGLRSPYAKMCKSLVSGSYAEPRAVYLNDHNESVPLEDCGLLEHDFMKLDSVGLKF